MKPKVTIILPVHNGLEATKKCLASIVGTAKYPYEILIIESESTDGTPEYLRKAIEWLKPLYVYWGKMEGLPKAFNIGLRETKGDVYITQNDVLFPLMPDKCWLERIVNIAYSDDKIGIVGTMDSYRTTHGWGPGAWVGTWSCYIKRSTIEKIGYFDEAFSPGCGEDIDYPQRVLQAGMKVAVAPLRVLHARGSVEHYNDFEALKKRNEDYYRKKWKT